MKYKTRYCFLCKNKLYTNSNWYFRNDKVYCSNMCRVQMADKEIQNKKKK